MKDTIFVLSFVWAFIIIIISFAFYIEKKRKEYQKIKESDQELKEYEKYITEQEIKDEEYISSNKLKILRNLLISAFIFGPILLFIFYRRMFESFQEFSSTILICGLLFIIVPIGLLIDKKWRMRSIKERIKNATFSKYEEKSKDIVPSLFALILTLFIGISFFYFVRPIISDFKYELIFLIIFIYGIAVLINDIIKKLKKPKNK